MPYLNDVFQQVSVSLLLVYCGMTILLYSAILDRNTRDHFLSPATETSIYLMITINALGILLYFTLIFLIQIGRPITRFSLMETLFCCENVGNWIIGGVILGVNYPFLKDAYSNDSSSSSMFGFTLTIYIARLILTAIAMIFYKSCLANKPLIVKANVERYLNVRPYSNWNVSEAPCIICLEEYTPDVLVAKLPCGHYYHKECLIIWNKTICPLCSQNIKSATNYHSIS